MISSRGYEPWIGPGYQGAAQRVLLLGESHYLTDPVDDSVNLTRDIIRDVRSGTRHLPFYTKSAALLDGADAMDGDTGPALWDRLAFFNYIPVVVGRESSAIPTPQMWAAGKDRFFTFLAELSPTHVLSLGQRQWDRISFPPGWTSVAATDSADAQVRRWLSPKGASIAATWVNHPSSRGFSPSKWRGRVRALLACFPTPGTAL
jgi:hypothetical protein